MRKKMEQANSSRKFTSISREAFEAFFYGRAPFTKLFSEELEWFSFQDGDVTLLGVMLLCKIDNDFNAVVLGRDAARRFRAIHMIASETTPQLLRTAMDASIADLVERHSGGAFAQGDEDLEPFAIFRMRVSEEKRNRYLKMLTDDPKYFPARVMMEELAHWFMDVDGVFIRALQGNEFNARLFELYLHAVFYELEFEIDRSHPQPDYVLKKGSARIGVEAVSIAEIEGAAPQAMDERGLADLLQHVNEEMPFRYARALQRKLRHRPEPLRLPYWELPHLKGVPFVIAVQDYSRPLSMTMSSSALQSYLYGIATIDGVLTKRDSHRVGTRSIPLGFFAREESKHVSAVLLAAGATLPKFNRMGRVAGLRSPTSLAVVRGVRTDDGCVPQEFQALVEDPRYREYWHEGIFVFHNPNAVTPLDPNLLPHVIHVFGEYDGISELLPPNYLLSSMTQMYEFPASEADRVWTELRKGLRENFIRATNAPTS